jgi:hypothetical protein
MAGKGDKPRPVNKKTYNENFDQINWNRNDKSKNNIEIKNSFKKITLKY